MRATSTFQAEDGNEYETLPNALGSGDQGAVYPGRRRSDGTRVAIKRITDGTDRGPDKNRELQIALRLGETPQHLIAPLTWAVDGADLLLVMPLADRSLADELAKHPNGLTEDAVVQILRDVTTGLAELRAHEIVHRDLKPANILLRDGRWHVADFGSSRDLDAKTATETFKSWGAVLYWAPERWQRQPATYKTDLYALGCIAYELATGCWLFPGPDRAQLQYQHLHVEPPPLSVGPALARWIMRLLDKDPAARHQDAQAALAALPAGTTVAGSLAAAGLQRAQRRQQKAAAQSAVDAKVESIIARRRQALADLADICAAAADRARQELPDVAWSKHGTSHRFSIDDVELVLIVWEPFGDYHGAVLAGEVSAFLNGDRRCAANIVCESDADRLTWYLDTVTRNAFTRDAMAGIVEAPGGFEHDTEFFDNYRIFLQGEFHAWERQRSPLTADIIVEFLADLLVGASQP